MSITRLEDVEIEKYVLAGLLNGPQYYKHFPEAWFKDPIARQTYKEIQKYYSPPYTVCPTVQIMIDECEEMNVRLFLIELSEIKVERNEYEIKLHKLFEMYAARKVFDLAASVPQKLQTEEISKIVQGHIQTLSTLINPLVGGIREREWIFDGAQNRWLSFKDRETNPGVKDALPMHIAELDHYLNGGLRPTHMMLLYAETGGLKTKTKANIGYNTAFIEGKDTMIVSLEVPLEDYKTIIDSRHSLTDFSGILRGELGEERLKYREALVDINTSKYPLFIVDIPDKATPADLINELELYYAINHKYPELVIIDYFNEMEPMSPWNNTSEKFKNLGVELRRINRTYKTRIIGSMQANRELAKISDKTKGGLEHIGESHYFSNVFQVIIHLYQDEQGVDEVTNTLNWSIKKNRYGPKNVTFATFANPAINYIGDRQIL